MSEDHLPVILARELADQPLPTAPRYLVEALWSHMAVGIVGGEPKCFKSLVSLHMAVAVASGTPCFGRYTVPTPGPVLVYPAEDSAEIVRLRLEGICRNAGTPLGALDLGVITAPTVRLDHERDRNRLARTVALYSPVLLILDPFVRLHRKDENASGDMAPLLAFLRELQRAHGVAIAVVHHARKGGGGMRPGQALRGSSEFHAWGDSNLYLRRSGEHVVLQVEHRAAPSIDEITLELVASDEGANVHLELSDDPPDQSAGNAATDQAARVLDVLAVTLQPISRADLRDQCRMKTATLSCILAELVQQARVVRDDHGRYILARAS